MKRFILFLFVMTMVAFVASAGGQKSSMSKDSGPYLSGQTETAYAYTHGGYVGMAKVQVNNKGLLSVSLNEAFLPHTLAMVDLEAGGWTESNTIEFDSHGPAYAAKYVEYMDKVYVAVSTGMTFSYVESDEKGMPAGNTDLEKIILRNQASMEMYYKTIKSGGFKIFESFGGKATSITTTKYGAVTKAESEGYWAFGQTWKGNITAIEEFIAFNGVQFNESDMMRAKEENAEGLKFWSVADAVSSATNSDFKDYFALAQHAAGKLKTK